MNIMTKQQEKVQSWLDNEDRCVTTQKIAQSMNVSRLEASECLSQIMQQSGGDKHVAMAVESSRQEEQGVPVTVFRLRPTTKLLKDATIMALASKVATESISTAHERDMLEWREMVNDGRHAECQNLDGAIAPADEILESKDTLPVSENNASAAASSAPTATSTSSNHHKTFHGKKKVTTAASFFGTKSKTSDVKPTCETTSTNTNNSNSKASKTPPQPAPSKENKIRANQVAPQPSKTTKDDTHKPNIKKNQEVGNADDFVADAEESDDEDLEAAKRNKKQQVAARRKAVQEAKEDEQRSGITHEESDNESPNEHVMGAMDAFATQQAKKAAAASTTNGRQRKRRKRLVEETVMVNGYLRTETKAVWEDVPTDEELEEQQHKQERIVAKKTAAPKPKNLQGMKQKSLMGFFTKK